jgi:Phosphotransferase enzyme family
MTTALERDLPDVEVATVDVLERDDGTNRRARLGVTYARGTGPPVFFVKGEGSFREAHARNGNLFNEPELYASSLLIPIDHPHPYHAVIDRSRLDYAIVMEDVTLRSGEPTDARDPMTVERVEHGVQSLAALHSRYWEGANLADQPWLQTWKATPGWQESFRSSVPLGAARAHDLLPDEVQALTTDVVANSALRSMETFGTGRLTLLHADPHVGNTYLLPDNDVGFLDWQVCRRGSWAQDLAYFLVSALTVEDRRSSEGGLLAAYRAALTVPADALPSETEMWDRFAASHPYGLAVWLATHRSDRAQRPDVCRALIERFAAAFVDHDSLGALDRLAA